METKAAVQLLLRRAQPNTASKVSQLKIYRRRKAGHHRVDHSNFFSQNSRRQCCLCARSRGPVLPTSMIMGSKPQYLSKIAFLHSSSASLTNNQENETLEPSSEKAVKNEAEKESLQTKSAKKPSQQKQSVNTGKRRQWGDQGHLSSLENYKSIRSDVSNPYVLSKHFEYLLANDKISPQRVGFVLKQIVSPQLKITPAQRGALAERMWEAYRAHPKFDPTFFDYSNLLECFIGCDYKFDVTRLRDEVEIYQQGLPVRRARLDKLLIQAFAAEGNIKQAMHHFEKVFGEDTTYNMDSVVVRAMVIGYAKNLDLHGAWQFLQKLESEGHKLERRPYLQLLLEASKRGDSKMAMAAVDKIIVQGGEPTVQIRNLLFRTYGVEGNMKELDSLASLSENPESAQRETKFFKACYYNDWDEANICLEEMRKHQEKPRLTTILTLFDVYKANQVPPGPSALIDFMIEADDLKDYLLSRQVWVTALEAFAEMGRYTQAAALARYLSGQEDVDIDEQIYTLVLKAGRKSPMPPKPGDIMKKFKFRSENSIRFKSLWKTLPNSTEYLLEETKLQNNYASTYEKAAEVTKMKFAMSKSQSPLLSMMPTDSMSAPYSFHALLPKITRNIKGNRDTEACRAGLLDIRESIKMDGYEMSLHLRAGLIRALLAAKDEEQALALLRDFWKKEEHCKGSPVALLPFMEYYGRNKNNMKALELLKESIQYGVHMVPELISPLLARCDNQLVLAVQTLLEFMVEQDIPLHYFQLDKVKKGLHRGNKDQVIAISNAILKSCKDARSNFWTEFLAKTYLKHDEPVVLEIVEMCAEHGVHIPVESIIVEIEGNEHRKAYKDMYNEVTKLLESAKATDQTTHEYWPQCMLRAMDEIQKQHKNLGRSMSLSLIPVLLEAFDNRRISLAPLYNEIKATLGPKVAQNDKLQLEILSAWLAFIPGNKISVTKEDVELFESGEIPLTEQVASLLHKRGPISEENNESYEALLGIVDNYLESLDQDSGVGRPLLLERRFKKYLIKGQVEEAEEVLRSMKEPDKELVWQLLLELAGAGGGREREKHQKIPEKSAASIVSIVEKYPELLNDRKLIQLCSYLAESKFRKEGGRVFKFVRGPSGENIAGDFPALYRLFQFRCDGQALEEAEKLAARLVTTASKNIQFWIYCNLLGAYARAGKMREGENMYNTIIRDYPEYYKQRVGMVESEMIEGISNMLGKCRETDRNMWFRKLQRSLQLMIKGGTERRGPFDYLGTGAITAMVVALIRIGEISTIHKLFEMVPEMRFVYAIAHQFMITRFQHSPTTAAKDVAELLDKRDEIRADAFLEPLRKIARGQGDISDFAHYELIFPKVSLEHQNSVRRQMMILKEETRLYQKQQSGELTPSEVKETVQNLVTDLTSDGPIDLHEVDRLQIIWELHPELQGGNWNEM
eukprot:m.94524 g.94524  ORF g.94524 m.94524 type:complete len:1421 (+) comp13449_c1_seq1:91-4353(+)